MDSMWYCFVTVLTAYPSAERFNCRRVSDHVVLSVASVLLMRSQSAEFRFQIATALWCNYGDTYLGPKDVKFQKELVESFIFIVFGRHVTLDEVEKLRLIGSHLPQNQVVHTSA